LAIRSSASTTVCGVPVPAQHDLQVQMEQYVRAAGSRAGRTRSPVPHGEEEETELSNRGLTGNDLLRIVKRRLKGAGLPEGAFCCHSFRAIKATNLLK